jgi:hypothetical protein
VAPNSREIPGHTAGFLLNLMPFGSSSLLVIWGKRSNIATSETRVVISKLLVNQWRSEPSSRGPLSQ